MIRVWYFNYDSSERGRIWFGWNPEAVLLRVVGETDECVHCVVETRDNALALNLSFVYGD